MYRRAARLAWLLLVVLPVGCATVGPGAQPPDAVPEPEATEVSYVQARPAAPDRPEPEVIAVPKPVPMPGQLKAVGPPGEPCPICIERGVSPRAQTLDHSHKTHEIIAYANRQARQKPDVQGYINSVQIYDYMPGALFQVYSAPTSVTSIMLQPGEHLTTYAAGDTVRWIVESTTSGQGDHEHDLVLVKPMKSGLHTNLVMTTDRRTYLLELHSYKETYMAAVSWHYPHDTLATAVRQRRVVEAKTRDIIAPQVSLQHLYFGYEIQTKRGTPRWKPVRVFDDGRKTYIQFPENLATTEAPALFILSRRQKAQLVNYRVKGTYYIVDRLFERAELRVGQQKPTRVRIIRQDRETTT